MLVWYDESAANDRFLFAVFVAAALHAAVILGIGFTRELHDPLPQSLEVTLARRSDADTNENADFLAQRTQLGSGTEQQRQELSTATVAEFASPRETQHLFEQDSVRETPPTAPPSVQAHNSEHRLNPETTATTPALAGNGTMDAVEPSPSTEIESLMARLAVQQQQYARMPRVARLTSVSTRTADDAEYLFNWKQRIEMVGNQHYPPEAKRRRLYGDLRLLVALRPDGSVLDMRVLQSSGEPVLDEAAKHIVRLAAPFEPFPSTLRARVDVLQIIRTWQFRLNRLTSSE